MRIQNNPSPTPTPKPKNSPSAADLIGINGTKSNIDVFLGSDEYKNIDETSAAKMLGHFTQGMQAQGFPWRLYSSTKEGLQGKLTGTKTLADLDALRKLQNNEPVLFQPMRNMQLDLSSDSIGAIAAAGTIGGGAEITGMTRLANLTRSTRVTAGSQGFEVRHGEPIEVRNLAELKLLYQMYRLEEKLTSRDVVGRAAQQLSYFNQQAGDFGWRYYQKDDSNAIGRIAKGAYKDGLRGLAMGLAVGGMVGGPIALFMRSISPLLYGVGIGAAALGAYSGIQGARAAAKGKPLNTVEALDSILNNKPVEMQETQMRGFGVPVLGKVSWVSDRGMASTVDSPKQLETLFWMQHQGAKEDPPPQPPEPPKPTTVIIDQSKHYYGNSLYAPHIIR
jgi:hypothetical protein